MRRDTFAELKCKGGLWGEKWCEMRQQEEGSAKNPPKGRNSLAIFYVAVKTATPLKNYVIPTIEARPPVVPAWALSIFSFDEEETWPNSTTMQAVALA